MDVFVNLIDARSSLEVLLEDRGLLHEELNLLKQSSEVDPDQLEQLENCIEVRSAQISDFQQKIMDSDEGNCFI